MSSLFFGWLLLGVACTSFARWALRLTFRDPVTMGTIMGFALGVFLPPIALLAGAIFLIAWATEPDQKYHHVKWPDWWGRIQYRQHTALRRLWYLGSPPDQENWVSGWRDAPSRYRITPDNVTARASTPASGHTARSDPASGGSSP